MSAGNGDAPLIDPELAGRVLEAALVNGGDLAEVYCEERSGLSLSIDEQRLERAQRGARARRRGASDQRRDDLLRARRRPRRARPDPRRRGRRRGALRRAHRAPAGSRRRDPAPPGDRDPARGRQRRAQGRDPARRRRARPRGRRRDHPGPGLIRRGAPPRRRRQLRRAFTRPTTAPACASASRSSRVRDGVTETGFETLGGHRGFELVEADGAEDRRRGGREGADHARRRPGARRDDAGRRRRRLRRRALPRDDRPRPRGRRGPEGASVYSGKLGEQVAEPIVNAYDDGLLPGEWGTNAIDDEGTPSQKTLVIEDGRITSIPLRPPPRAPQDAATRPATAAARASATCRSRA